MCVPLKVFRSRCTICRFPVLNAFVPSLMEPASVTADYND